MPMVEHFKFLAAHTRQTPKITIPSPSAIYGRPVATPIDKKAYPDMDAFWDDLGNAYKKAVRGFADAGCRYLQLDEVFIAMLCDPKYRDQMVKRGDDPDKLGPIYGDLINAAMSDIPSDMTITHASVPRQLQIDLHGLGRLRRRGRGAVRPHQGARLFHGIRHRARRRLRAAAAGAEGSPVVLGLVTTKTGELESKDAIKRRIDEAAKYISLDQLCLSPQCGFASTEEGNTLTEEQQWAKLRMIVEVAEEVWGSE